MSRVGPIGNVPQRGGQITDEVRVVMDVVKQKTGGDLDPLLAKKIVEVASAKEPRRKLLKRAFRENAGSNLPDELLSEILGNVNEKSGVIYRQKRPMNRQAAYVKFVSENRQKLGRPAGPNAVHNADKDSVAKVIAESFLRRPSVLKWTNDLPRTDDVWTDLAAYYNKVRDQTQDTSVERRDMTTGYVRNPSTGRKNKIGNLSAKQAQKLKVFKRKKCGPDGNVEFLCYWGLADDGVCKRCRVSSLPRGMRNTPQKPFWSSKPSEAKKLAPRETVPTGP